MSLSLNRRRIGLSWAVALCAAVLLLLSRQTGIAQEVQAGARADLARSQTDTAPGLSGTGDLSHAPSSPNDADLGEQAILKRSEGYKPFSVSAIVPCYWTSNVALTRSHEEDDFLVAPAVALSYQPRFSQTLYGLVSVREQLFYYNDFDALNFGSFYVDAGLIYLVPAWHNLTLRAIFEYERLTEKDSFDSFFDNYSILLSAEIPFRLDRAQSLTLGVDANVSFDANPEPPRRNEYGAYAVYSVALTRFLTVDASGRLVIRTYQLTDRVDVSEIFAASANFRITDWMTASAISSLSANQSNHEVFDYKVANLGGLLSLNVRF